MKFFLPRKIVSLESWAMVRAVWKNTHTQPAGHTDLCGLLHANKLLTSGRNYQLRTTAFLAFRCSLGQLHCLFLFKDVFPTDHVFRVILMTVTEP